MNRNSGSLCLLSVLCGGCPSCPCHQRVHLIPTWAVDQCHQLSTARPSHLPILLWPGEEAYVRAPSALDYHRTCHQGVERACAGGGL